MMSSESAFCEIVRYDGMMNSTRKSTHLSQSPKSHNECSNRVRDPLSTPHLTDINCISIGRGGMLNLKLDSILIDELARSFQCVDPFVLGPRDKGQSHLSLRTRG